ARRVARRPARRQRRLGRRVRAYRAHRIGWRLRTRPVARDPGWRWRVAAGSARRWQMATRPRSSHRAADIYTTASGLTAGVILLSPWQGPAVADPRRSDP